MATLEQTLRTLAKLNTGQRWDQLREHALASSEEHPDSADVAAYVAHAMRQLGELEEGYGWAIRARTIDPDNLFAINRVSLLANLTKRYDVAFESAVPVLDRDVATDADRQNLAVTIVNAINGASLMNRIADAVKVFSPAIERLDHEELHFNSACLYTLGGDDARAFKYIAKALATGKAKTSFADRDFDRLRGDARFAGLLARDWDAENAALRRSNKTSRDALVPEDFIEGLAEGSASGKRHAELERAIDANIDDVEGYIVYSDWLQGESDPRGMFILASKRFEDAKDETERMLACVDWAKQLREHGDAWLGQFSQYAQNSRWRHGFIRDLVFDIGYEGDDEDASHMFAATLALPMCRFLRSITIGDVWCDEEMSYRSIVDVLRDASLPHLRALQIAPVDFQMSWSHLDVSDLANAQIESLVVGGNVSLGALRFPKLKRFAVRTGGLTRENFDDICQADFPLLEDLEIWFGDQRYGADEFTAADLQPLFARRLRRLALKNADFTDQIANALVTWRNLPYLTELDLSMGLLGADGARTLIDHAQHFGHLTKLDVSENILASDVVDAVRAALPKAFTGIQKRHDRYVSVGE